MNKMKMITLTVLTLLLTIGCDDNSTGSTPPESATISGTITFTGVWPVSGPVAISINTNWPPMGAPANSNLIEEGDIVNNTYSYSFDAVTFGTYASIAVSWQDINDDNPATNQHTLGAYGGTVPTIVTVSETEYELMNIDFDANLNLIPGN